MVETYSNREIDNFFREFRTEQRLEHEKLQQSMNEVKEIGIRVEAQTKKTNGSVADLKLWRSYMIGAIAVILFLIGTVVIPLVSAYVQLGKL